MKKIFCVYFLYLLSPFILKAQISIFPVHLQKTAIAKLQNNDSLIFYQCHVDEATQETTTSTGQKIVSKKKKLTITEKFVITKKDSLYICQYFISSLTNYPNKKFPYLTLKEVDNWDFQLKNNRVLVKDEVLMLAAIETKSHAIVHMELNINKTCPNEIIICSKKDREQLIIEGNYLLSKNLKVN